MEYVITTREFAEQPVLIGRRRAPRAEIAAAIGEVLSRVFAHAREHGLAVTGRPFVRYVDPNPEMITFEPGMPIASDIDTEQGGDAREAAGLALDILPGGTVACTIHVGPYETLPEAYAAVQRWFTDEGLTPAGAPWESYLTDPSRVPESTKWKTEIFWPVAAG